MSLSASLNTAVSGLQTNQTLMRIVSANISSANVEGYTKKRGELETLVLNNMGAGVSVADITRQVDEYLLRETSVQTSVSASADTLLDFYTRMQDQFGSPDANGSIAGELNELRNVMEALALDPSASVQQFRTATAAVDLANSLNSLSKFVQKLRQEADQQIDSGTTIINNNLQEIESLNNVIVKNTVTGQPVGDFLDKRDNSLREISTWLDIKWYERSSGETAILTGSNYSLLDVSARSLKYTSPAGVSADTVYPGGFQPIEIEGVVDDLTPQIGSGKLAALIDLRDNILPGLQAQLDQLTTAFSNEVNRAHNSSMPVPGLNAFVGVNNFDTTTLLDVTNPESIPLNPFTDNTQVPPLTEYGNFEIAIIDSNGDGVGAGLRVNLDEFKAEMEAYVLANGGGVINYQVTAGDIINMINGAYAATPPTGIPVPPTPAGWPGGVTWPPTPALIMTSTGSDIAGLFNLSGASVSGGLSNGRFAGMVNGKLHIELPSNSPYGLAIDDTDITLDDGSARSSGFNYMFGLNNLFVIPPTAVSSADSIAVREDIAKDPGKVGRGTLQSTLRDPLDPTTEEWYVAKGDGSGAQAMSDAFAKKLDFVGAGNMPSSNQTLEEYAAEMIQSNAADTTAASDNLTYRRDLLVDLQNRMGATSGVNVDEELANLINIQNNYSASSRIITTVNQMYDDLLSIV